MKYLIYIKNNFFILLLFAMAGCYKDNGNYSYGKINDLKITDPASNTAINVNYEDTLKLKPEISQAVAKDESGLTFEWSVYKNDQDNPATPITVLSTERNLSAKVVYPFTLGSNFYVVYKVTVRETGISTYLRYTVNVVNKFSQGWVVMEDMNGATDYSMILLNGEVVRHLYKGLNGASLPGKPRCLYLTTFPVADDITVSSKKMYLISETGGVELSYTTLAAKFGLDALFFKSPSVLAPSSFKWYSGNLGIVINDGKLHINAIGGFPGAKKFGEILLTPAGDLNYQLAPFSAGGTTVYDNKGKRFYQVQTTGTTMYQYPSQASTLFDLNNVGMDMIYMSESSVSGQADAFMKDASSQVYYLRVKTSNNTAAPALTMAKEKIDVPGVADMAAAASSVVSPHVFFATGNKIYRYEHSSNTTQLKFSFPENEKITILQCPLPFLGAPQLVAVTWNGTESKVYFFEISLTGDITNWHESYGGFNKVVSFAMKS